MIRKAAVLATAFFILASLQAGFAQEVLTNDSVLQLMELGFSDDLIIQKIDSTEVSFDLSLDGLASLQEAGVSEEVLSAMLDKVSNPGRVEAPTAEAAEPKREAGIYLYRTTPVDGQSTKVDKLMPSVFTQARAGGILKSAFTGGLAKIKTYAVLPGPRAEMGVESRSPLFRFVFDTTDSGLARNTAIPTSPRDFVLAKLEVRSKKGNTNRELLVGKAGATGVKEGMLDEAVIDFYFEEIDTGVYEVGPKRPLEPGEYCFIPKTAEEGDYIWDFSVR